MYNHYRWTFFLDSVYGSPFLMWTRFRYVTLGLLCEGLVHAVHEDQPHQCLLKIPVLLLCIFLSESEKFIFMVTNCLWSIPYQPISDVTKNFISNSQTPIESRTLRNEFVLPRSLKFPHWHRSTGDGKPGTLNQSETKIGFSFPFVSIWRDFTKYIEELFCFHSYLTFDLILILTNFYWSYHYYKVS